MINKELYMIMMVGISGSGKSTVAKKISEDYSAKIHSSDELRKELFGNENEQNKNGELFEELHKRIINDLMKGNSVIYDATNINLNKRKCFMDLLYMHDIKCTKIAYVIDTPFYRCLINNSIRERAIPEEVITNQREKFQIPFYEEGFDDIIFYYDMFSHEFNHFASDDLYNHMKEFDQECKYHSLNLYDHSYKVLKLFGNKIDENVLSKYVIENACMLHDCGKFLTKTRQEDGNCTYYGHENVGTYALLEHRNLLFGIENKKDFIDCLFIVNYHMLGFVLNSDKTSEKTKKKYLHIFGEEKYNLLKLFNECDNEACH